MQTEAALVANAEFLGIKTVEYELVKNQIFKTKFEMEEKLIKNNNQNYQSLTRISIINSCFRSERKSIVD